MDTMPAQLRALKLESDPSRLMEGLGMFTEYDEVVAMDKDSLRDRHRVLVDGAVLDIRNCLKDERSDLRYMAEVVEKFQNFPERVRELLQGLSNKLESKVLTADKIIRWSLASTDIDEINKVIVEYGPDEQFLKDALSALTNHRLDLEDDMRLQLKQAMAAEVTASTPEAVQSLLYDAQPYGSGVAEEKEALEEWLASLLDKSVNEISELSTSQVAVGESPVILLTSPISFPIETPTKGRAGCSKNDRTLADGATHRTSGRSRPRWTSTRRSRHPSPRSGRCCRRTWPIWSRRPKLRSGCCARPTPRW